MNKADFKWWTKFRDTKHSYLIHEEYLEICNIYSRLFNLPLVYFCKGCGNKFQEIINEINVEYDLNKQIISNGK